MIYADAHERYGQSLSLSLESVPACGHGSVGEWLGALLGGGGSGSHRASR